MQEFEAKRKELEAEASPIFSRMYSQQQQQQPHPGGMPDMGAGGGAGAGAGGKGPTVEEVD